MRMAHGSIFRWLVIPYSPCPTAGDSWTPPSPSGGRILRSGLPCWMTWRVGSSLASRWPGVASSLCGFTSSTGPPSRTGFSS